MTDTLSGQSAADGIQVERRDKHAVVTINRPEKRNAISIAVADAFQEALAGLSDVPVIVLTGAGDRAFSAGMDLNERAEHRGWNAALGVDRGHFWMETLAAMKRHPAIFVAAVNGVAVGGGLTLVNNCELAVAAESAEFGMPELGFGAFPALAGPSTMRRILPKHVAQLVLTSRRVDAQTALSWGLVNEVVPSEELMSRAEELAASLAERDPVALGFCKKGLRDLEQLDWDRAMDYGTTMSTIVKNIQSATQGAPR